ncbi:hypothetical protein CALK_1741 [Chitinivibrio alkaliphilus ACht1]|uniref:Uncharacterized protein n=2 Tax=Chitinivibrio TaxID=1505231 RepID=U7D8I4_9BACT|nr:hypothetical protein CALK_1741 [Chitinivibrio alkaliphilus ACht1]
MYERIMSRCTPGEPCCPEALKDLFSGFEPIVAVSEDDFSAFLQFHTDIVCLDMNTLAPADLHGGPWGVFTVVEVSSAATLEEYTRLIDTVQQHSSVQSQLSAVFCTENAPRVRGVLFRGRVRTP